jgi:electron transfer flavoprotein alpha subunit
MNNIFLVSKVGAIRNKFNMLKTFKGFSNLISKKYFSTLLVAEHNNQKLANNNLNMITASLKLKEKVHPPLPVSHQIDVLIAGHGVDKVVEQAQSVFPGEHTKSIYVMDHQALKHQ